MTTILKTTLTSAFAIASIAGASVAFAADNGGKNNDHNNTNSAGDKDTKSNKCADDNNATNSSANCTTEPNAEQQ